MQQDSMFSFSLCDTVSSIFGTAIRRNNAGKRLFQHGMLHTAPSGRSVLIFFGLFDHRHSTVRSNSSANGKATSTHKPATPAASSAPASSVAQAPKSKDEVI
jgi:hypothetical protein